MTPSSRLIGHIGLVHHLVLRSSNYFLMRKLNHNQSATGKRQQVADELNQLNDFSQDEEGTRQAMVCYRGLSNDAFRVLAGLPGNERAFSQLDDPNQ